MRNIVSLITLVFLLVSSCQISEHKSDAPYILASTGMLHDVIQHIVGDSIPVQVLMNPGVDPHLYKASLGDLAKIMELKIGIILKIAIGSIMQITIGNIIQLTMGNIIQVRRRGILLFHFMSTAPAAKKTASQFLIFTLTPTAWD